MGFSLSAAAVHVVKGSITKTSQNQSKTSSTSSLEENNSLAQSGNLGPTAEVSGSQGSLVSAALTRFQTAIKTGVLGKDFMQGLTDPAPYAAMGQQQQQAQQLAAMMGGGFGSTQQKGSEQKGSEEKDWSDHGAKNRDRDTNDDEPNNKPNVTDRARNRGRRRQ